MRPGAARGSGGPRSLGAAIVLGSAGEAGKASKVRHSQKAKGPLPEHPPGEGTLSSKKVTEPDPSHSTREHTTLRTTISNQHV